jgi:hypothetical protein
MSTDFIGRNVAKVLSIEERKPERMAVGRAMGLITEEIFCIGVLCFVFLSEAAKPLERWSTISWSEPTENPS